METILRRFPLRPTFAFAYGSSVFHQPSNAAPSANRMLDLVLAVDDPLQWHTANLDINPSDYSFIRYGGASFVTSLQTNWGARILYNSLIPLDASTAQTVGASKLKYGVISTHDLHQDLLHWRSLYVAGRMHKPIRVLVDHAPTQDCQRVNLKRALSMAACMHASTAAAANSTTASSSSSSTTSSSSMLVPKEELFMQIARLSYSGDVRMGVAEHGNKIADLVKGSYPHWCTLYDGIVAQHADECGVRLVSGQPDMYAVAKEAQQLHQWQQAIPKQMLAMPTLALEGDRVTADRVQKVLSEVVAASSKAQTIKGLLSAGVGKSFVYVREKVAKALKSKPR